LLPNDYFELLLARIFRVLPLTLVAKIGSWLGARQGRRGIKAGRLWVARMHNNLERLWGVTDPLERERRIIEHARRVGRTYAEIPVLDRLVKAGKLEVQGLENLEHLSKPFIIISAHLSNWELMGRVTEIIGGHFCDVYLPLSGARAQLAYEARLKWRYENNKAGELIPAGPGALRAVTKAIVSGSNVLLFIDEEKDGFIRAPSLSREIPYMGNRWFAARLAVRHQLDVLPIYVESSGEGSYRAVIEPRLVAPGKGDTENQARALADLMDARLDDWVRKSPDDWYWLPLLDIPYPPKESQVSPE
jgi:Kdo2-lipid IVA lauroyltransferase/acyltransferase